ncbi:MAG TPA: hypothetical protein VEP50_11580 [bacterium]|nr:hypothetical protein [bacterium]
MRLNADLPDVAVHDGNDLPVFWPMAMSADVKAALVVLACLAAVVGAAIWFVRFVGI